MGMMLKIKVLTLQHLPHQTIFVHHRKPLNGQLCHQMEDIRQGGSHLINLKEKKYQVNASKNYNVSIYLKLKQFILRLIYIIKFHSKEKKLDRELNEMMKCLRILIYFL